jgi:hypothetical protein
MRQNAIRERMMDITVLFLLGYSIGPEEDGIERITRQRHYAMSCPLIGRKCGRLMSKWMPVTAGRQDLLKAFSEADRQLDSADCYESFRPSSVCPSLSSAI